MGSGVQVFHFDGSDALRCGQFDNGDVYVVAADVCKIAGHGNPTQAVSRLDPDERGLISNETPGSGLVYVTESGFYALILSFRLRKDHPNHEKLRRFRKWVTSEVIPAIRQNGFYAAPGVPMAPTGGKIADAPTTELLAMAELLVGNLRKQVVAERRLAMTEAQLEATRQVAAGADLKADAALATLSDDTKYISLVGWNAMHKLKLTQKQLSAAGRALTAECRATGTPVKQAFSEVWGEINVYPKDVLGPWLDGFLARKGWKVGP